jgi:hypothetical protein
MVENENLKNFLNAICDLDCKIYLDLRVQYDKCSKTKSETNCIKLRDEKELCFHIQ